MRDSALYYVHRDQDPDEVPLCLQGEYGRLIARTRDGRFILGFKGEERWHFREDQLLAVDDELVLGSENFAGLEYLLGGEQNGP